MIPVYVIPQFNLTCDVWDPGLSPGAADPATYSAIPCQLYVLSRSQGLPAYELRMPSNIPGFVLTAGTAFTFSSGFEISSLPGHYFGTLTRPYVVHSGFPNEYWAVLLFETDDLFTTAMSPVVLP